MCERNAFACFFVDDAAFQHSALYQLQIGVLHRLPGNDRERFDGIHGPTIRFDEDVVVARCEVDEFKAAFVVGDRKACIVSTAGRRRDGLCINVHADRRLSGLRISDPSFDCGGRLNLWADLGNFIGQSFTIDDPTNHQAHNQNQQQDVADGKSNVHGLVAQMADGVCPTSGESPF